MEEKNQITLEIGYYIMGLVKASLYGIGAPEKPDFISYKELYKLTKKQNIQTIIFLYLKSVNNFENDPMYISWSQSYEHSKIHLLTLESERKRIAAKLEESKIAYLNLKGSVLKDYYPNPFMRQMGDYDILYDSRYQKELIQIMEGFGYSAEDLKGKDDDFTKKPFYRFEFHRELFEEFQDSYEYFSHAWERAVRNKEDSYEYHFTNEDFYIFFIAHFAKHFKNEGCGIRPLIDIHVFLQKEQESMDWDYVEKELTKIQLVQFEKEMKELSVLLFQEKTLNKRQEQQFLYLLSSGTYGNAEIRLTNQLKNFQGENEDKKYVKIGYTFRRLFPSFEFMKQGFPCLRKYPWLLPFCYIARWGMRAVRWKKVMKELKKIKDFH